MTYTIQNRIINIQRFCSVNMLDFPGVKQEALNRGYLDLVDFIDTHREEYVKYICTGEAKMEREDKETFFTNFVHDLSYDTMSVIDRLESPYFQSFIADVVSLWCTSHGQDISLCLDYIQELTKQTGVNPDLKGIHVIGFERRTDNDSKNS